MATLHDGGPPRKKIVTYGKAARKRIPEYEGFNAVAHKSADKEITSKQDAPTAFPSLLAPSNKPRTVVQRAKTPILQSLPKSDILDVPMNDDIAPKLPPKKLGGSPKIKAAPQKFVPNLLPTKQISPTSIFDVPESDNDTPQPIRKPATSPKPRNKPKTKTKVSITNAASRESNSSTSIYDIPDDADEPTRPIRKLAPSPRLVQKVKSVSQPSISKILPQRPVAPSSIFDVPMGDNEVPQTKPVHKRTQQTSKSLESTAKNSTQNSVSIADDGQRKKLKLSPAQEPASNVLSIHPRSPKSRATSRPPRQTTTSPKVRPMNKLSSKTLPLRRQERPRSPLKLSPTPMLDLAETEISSPGDVDLMDLDIRERKSHISPKGLRMWQDILDTTTEIENGIYGMNAHSTSNSRLHTKLLKTVDISKSAQKTQSGPRKRLIDSLVSQTEESFSSDTETSEEDESEPESPNPITHPRDTSRAQSVIPEFSKASVMVSDSQGSQLSQGIGPKFTYGRQRSMLAEQDIMKELAMELPMSQPAQAFGGRKNRRGSIPSLQPLPSFHEEEEDTSTTQLKTVHELRKAGANNRFLYEAQDLIDGIGHPEKTSASIRRSGLLDLAAKLKDKEFMDQFRTHSMELKLFIHLGQEKDIVCGYLMISILVLVLNGTPMPHIIAHLRRQGITRLIIRLLECQQSIAAICKERKSNMSRSAQSLVVEHHNDLLKVPIWDELQPQSIFPQTLALKCLESMVRQTRTAGDSGDIFSKELTTMLFDILKNASNEASWDLPQGKEAIDFNLALATLELHSLTARTVRDELIWTSNFLPIMADTLEIAYSQPSATFGRSHLLIARMSAQITNRNSKASDIFARPRLMEVLGQAIIAKFHELSRFLMEDDFVKVLDHLVVLIGASINLADNANARDAYQSLQDSSNDPLDGLVQIFVDHRAQSFQADNLQLAQKNIPFGWLSVMLGFFCLQPDLAVRIKAMQPGNTLRPLVASIEEFAMIHKNADKIIEDEEGYSPQTGVTERLEELLGMVKAVA